MPALKDVLTKGLPEGYIPVENAPTAPPATSPVDDAQFSSPTVRCPLPPTNADADSLRTFQKGSSTPQFRVMPLPPQTGGSTTVTEGGSSSSSSGSGGGTAVSVATTVSTTVNIPANGATITRIAATQSFQLLSISTNAPCCVRLYGNAAAQDTDSSRAIDAPVSAELTQNIIIDLVFDTAPYFWTTQNIMGVNADSPQGTILYITVLNPTAAPLSNATVYITYLPLET